MLWCDARVSRSGRRGLSCGQVPLVPAGRFRSTLVEQRRKTVCQRRHESGAGRSKGRGRQPSSIWFYNVGRQAEEIKSWSFTSCSFRWGRLGSSSRSTGRWRSGDTPGWNWSPGARIILCTSRSGRCPRSEARGDPRGVGRRGAEGKEREEEEKEESGGSLGSGRNGETEEGGQRRKKEEQEQVTEKETAAVLQKETKVEVKQRDKAQSESEPFKFLGQPGPSSEAKSPTGPRLSLQAPGGSSSRAISPRRTPRRGLCRRWQRRQTSKDLHILPVGVATKSGQQEPGLQRDQSLGSLPRYAARRPLGKFGRHPGRSAFSRGNGHPPGVGNGPPFGGVRPRRGRTSTSAYSSVCPKAPTADREGGGKGVLAAQQPVELVGLDRCSPQGEGQRPKRKRKEREGERKRQRREDRRCRGEAKRRRMSDEPEATAGAEGPVVADHGSLAGDTAFESLEVPSEIELTGQEDVSMSRPLHVRDEGALGAEKASSCVDTSAGMVCRAEDLDEETWHRKLKSTTDLSVLGILLAWGLYAGLIPLSNRRAGPTQLAPQKSKRRGLFPLSVSIPVSVAGARSWSFLDGSAEEVFELAKCCWLALCSASLNCYYGTPFAVNRIRKGKVHAAVELNLLGRIGRFLKSGVEKELNFESVISDLKEKRITYTGEEVSQPYPLSVSQIMSGLPPSGHGGAIPLLPFLVGRTKFLMENPLESLLAETERGASPCQAKVHIKGGEALSVFGLLAERGIVGWTDEAVAFRDNRGVYLNGLFGVIKPNKFTTEGLPVLRVIMNFIPVNAIFEVIKGDISFLPSPTSWLPLYADSDDYFSLSQGDMQAAFYLFRLPPGWEPYMCFNFCASGDQIGLDSKKKYRPYCKVLPMGWASSVGIMQQISRQVLLMKGLPASEELHKIRGIPRWFTQAIAEGDHHRAWWQVYLDNFMSGEINCGDSGERGKSLQVEAMQAWSDTGILTAADKQVLGDPCITELGVLFNGSQKLLGASPERLLKTIWSSFHLLFGSNLKKREIQVVLGRWIFILQFRRAGMGILSRAWECVENFMPTPQQRERLKRELWMLVCMGPILQTDLTMEYDGEVTCSDASETGGAVAMSNSLTWSGRSFVHRNLNAELDPIHCPILVISCFNGIGGSFRIYDILGVQVLGRISIDISKEANRVTRSTWPGTEEYTDIKQVTQKEINRWANDFGRALEVHLWAGFPCVHLSSARAYRENLYGEGSNLFWDLLDVLKMIQDTFSTFAKVKFCVENVASMDQEARKEISEQLEVMPVKLDPADCLPFSRPRLAWCSEPLYQMEGIELWTEGDYVRAFVDGGNLATHQWIRPGWRWDGESAGVKFPTFMKAIKRSHPPPVPAGLRRATDKMKELWRQDHFRFPPYQYADKFLLQHTDRPDRLLDSSERELLLGFGPGHTATCMSASNMKRSLEQYEDVRQSLCGDSFCILSFAVMGAAMCAELLPRMSPGTIVQRLGLAPGATAHPRVRVPLSRWLAYGGDPDLPAHSTTLVQQLGLSLNHTGADVRVSSGMVLGRRPQSHSSVRAWWWQWKHLFKTQWIKPSHINLLEMKMILHAILWKLRKTSAIGKRWLHLEDSMVCLLILSKGRTSSHLLQPVCRQIGAVQLAAGSVLMHGHVSSVENPTDAASRAWR